MAVMVPRTRPGGRASRSTRETGFYSSDRARSFDAYPGVLDDAGPGQAVGLDHRFELFGRAAGNLGALHREFFLHPGGAHDPAHLRAEPRDDLARRARRSEQAIPWAHLVSWNA